jgi:membrane-bound inhibitor of C-type lysozyme
MAATTLGGCSTILQHHQPASVLHCENGETVEAGYAGDIAIVTYKNRRHRLRSAISGSGARYVGGGLQWWTKGFEEGTIASLQPGENVASGELVVCRAGPPPP